MKTLVTGASGFLGRAMVRRFVRDGDAVIGQGFSNAGPDQIRWDLRDTRQTRKWIRELAPDRVIHCAAYRDPDFCESNPEETRRLNVGAVRALRDALSSDAVLVQISTDYVFDGETPPYTEQSPRAPLNVYGRTKAEAEDVALERVGTLVIRIPLLVGEGPTFEDSGLIARLYRSLQDAQPQEADDLHIRFPTWIGDAADAAKFLLDRAATGVFHVSSSVGLTRYGCLRALAREAGLSAEHIRPSRTPSKPLAARPRNSQLDTARIRALGFAVDTPFDEAAARVLRRFPER